jgi:hypothetical protein
MSRRTLDTSPRERAEAWFFTGPPGRVLSLSADLALAVPMLIAYSARRAWDRVAGSSSDDDQSSAA